MRLHKNKLLTTVAAAALALAVGACSSSSDDDETVAAAAVTPPPVTTEPAPEPTPELTPAEQLTAAQAALTMAQGLVDALTSASSAEDAAAAYGALGAAQAALHAAANLPANQVAALQAQINQLVLDLEAANAIPSTETVALETAQADAATAATEAATAAAAAKVASDAAQTARENVASLQTGETSGDLAHAAYTQAKAAEDAAAAAQTASDAAAKATDGVAATRFLVMAETARDNAVAAQDMAETNSAAAVTATMTELMIDGKDKNVGGTSINADAASSVVTTAIGTTSQTVETGRIMAKDPEQKGFGAVTPGNEYVFMADAADTPYRQAVAGRDITIGRTLDTSDDMARLMLVTQYAGTKMVRVYKAENETRAGAKAGYITIQDRNTTEVDLNNVKLKSEGTYYPVNGTGALAPADMVLMTAKPNSPLKKASLTGFHATAKHIAAKAVSPSSETMRTI